MVEPVCLGTDDDPEDHPLREIMIGMGVRPATVLEFRQRSEVGNGIGRLGPIDEAHAKGVRRIKRCAENDADCAGGNRRTRRRRRAGATRVTTRLPMARGWSTCSSGHMGGASFRAHG
jgi:hypothetical protein